MRGTAAVLAALLGFATSWTGVALAEVSVDPHGPLVNTIIMGSVVDDPDPIGIWLQYRDHPPSQVLNASGHARGDGRPDIRFKTNTYPVAVWAYNAGTDHDIAFSEWDGNVWAPTEFLTVGTDDELDPRVAVEDDGTVHVVWWTTGGTHKVYLATRPAGSAVWDAPVLVTGAGEEGRRPAVAVDAGGLRVAYERGSALPGMAQDIVVATRQPGGSFTFEVVGSTIRTDRLDVMIHQLQDHLWLDWKHEADEFGCVEWQGSGWSPIGPESWDDPSWVGVESVRKLIQNRVLDP